MKARLGITLEGSYMVGDSPSDVEAGRRLGMITLRVATGRGGDLDGPSADHQVENLLAAARTIARLEAPPSEGIS